MDRLNQLRGEAGSSRSSLLDNSAASSEAYMTANESSRYFSLTEDDSSFDLSPIKDVSLASAANPDQAASTLTPIDKKDDNMLDSYKFPKQIEAANILSGGVDIFEDNSYDGNELVIDDNVDEGDDKSGSELKLSESEDLPFAKNELVIDNTVVEEKSGSKFILSDSKELPFAKDGLAIDENVVKDKSGSELKLSESEDLPLAKNELIMDNNIVDDKSGSELKLSENKAFEKPEGSELILSENEDLPFAKTELVIDENNSEVEDNSGGELKLSESQDLPFEKPEEVPEPPVVSKDKEIVLTIEGREVKAITIGVDLYLYRKEEQGELAAVQMIEGDQHQKVMKFLKVRENADGNLEVYEEIEIEVPREVPANEENPEQNVSYVPIVTEDLLKASTSDMAPNTNKESDGNGKMLKLNETRKSPVIHSTPNKEGVPLTKTMVDQQLHPNRQLDHVKTIPVHTEKTKQKVLDVKSENKEALDIAQSNKNESVDQLILERKQGADVPFEKDEKCINPESDGKSDPVNKEIHTNTLEESGKQIDLKAASITEPAEDANVMSKPQTEKLIPQPEDNILSQIPKQTAPINPKKSNNEQENDDKSDSKDININDEIQSAKDPIAEQVKSKTLELNADETNQSNALLDTVKVTESPLENKKESSQVGENFNKHISKFPVLQKDNKKMEFSKDSSDSTKTGTSKILDISQKPEKLSHGPSNSTNSTITIVNVHKTSLDTTQQEKIDQGCQKEKSDVATPKLIDNVVFKEAKIQKEAEITVKPQVIADTSKNLFENKRNSNVISQKNISLKNARPSTSGPFKEVDESKSADTANKEAKSHLTLFKKNALNDKIIPYEKKKQPDSKIPNVRNIPVANSITIKTSITKADNIAKVLCINNLSASMEVKTDKAIISNQTTKPDIKNIIQKPINNHAAPVPFGQWTQATTQEFLNKIKESKVPVNSCNTKQIKQPNDLNRRDVLQKIDSQRQSNTAALKAQGQARINQQNIKNEMKVFAGKSAPVVKNEAPVPQIKPTMIKNAIKHELPISQIKQPVLTTSTSEMPKKEMSQRQDFNNQVLIDRTIEGIINRATATKPDQEIKPNLNLKKDQPETPVPHNINSQKNEVPPAALDAIEKKMNELHGIPFVERPAHELPKVYNLDIKTYARSDKASSAKSKIPHLLPFTGKPQAKLIKENVIEVDSEEEIIEHEPVTGDIDKNSKIVSKLPLKTTTSPETQLHKVALNETKTVTVITEKDFDKFARRNSKTFEKCLTVNFEQTDQPNVVKTALETDKPVKKYSRNELLLAEAKVKSSLKHKLSQTHSHQNKIQITSKVIPVSDDAFNKNYPSKLQMAYHSALTTKRQMDYPITIIEDKPVKVVFMDPGADFAPARLNVQGRELSPVKKTAKEIDSATISTCDSLDSEVLDSIDALGEKAPEEIKNNKTNKHLRKQVLTPVETPELELIEPRDLGIEVSPKKRRKVEDDKTPKNVLPKKTYRNSPHTIEETPKEFVNNPRTETLSQAAPITHIDTASAIDNLVKAAELLETQEEKINSASACLASVANVTESYDNTPQQNTPVKRGRGRPRKYPLPEGSQVPVKSKNVSPQKKPRLIDSKRSKRHSTTEEEDDDDSSDDAMIKENWTMGKINENIVCPICGKLFRSENVVFKHVKHCTGPSPNRSDTEKRSLRRRSRISYESESVSRESQSLNREDIQEDKTVKNKITLKNRKSKDSVSDSSTDKDDIIVIEDTPLKERPEKRDQSKQHKSNPADRITMKSSKLTCEHCGKAFRQLSHLVNHKLQHKKEERNKLENDSQTIDKTVFSCETCKKEFRKLHHLVQHRLIHNPSNAPQRSSRKSSFEQSSNKVQQGSKQEDQTAAFRCEPCDKSFRKLHHLVEHRETHDGINRQKAAPQVADKQTTAPTPQCDICNKTFRKLHHLIEHKEQHVEVEKSTDKSAKASLSTKDIIHECSLCYMVFPNEHSLTKHTVICQRKKKQAAAKKLRQVEEKELNDGENPKTPEEDLSIVDITSPMSEVGTGEQSIQKASSLKNEQDKNESETVDVEKPLTHDNNQSETVQNSIEVNNKAQPADTNHEVEEKSDIKQKVVAAETPAVPTKDEVKIINDTDDSCKIITPRKKIKDKNASPATKRQKMPTKSPTPAAVTNTPNNVESSDDDEIRYMLNPDYKTEDKKETFMKVRAKKRSSLQIERPSSKDREVKRRTSLQNPMKAPRLKPRSLVTERTKPANKSPQVEPKPPVTDRTKLVNKTLKLKPPPPSTDSDDSEIKYSFPKTVSEKANAEQKLEVVQQKNKRKSLIRNGKCLVGNSRNKSLGQPHEASKPTTPASKIRRRTAASVEQRCDCGQLFSSAALLARHVSLAHTPPRNRKRRSSPPPPPQPQPIDQPKVRTPKSSPKNAKSKTRAHGGVPLPASMKKALASKRQSDVI